MTDFIGIDISGEKEIAAKLDKLPEQAADFGVEYANEYILNMQQTYVPYKYVSVAQTGGWKSDAQRRYVMAKIRSGEISVPYNRTQTLRKGWKLVGKGRNQIVANEVDYAKYVKDIRSQSQGHMLRGWEVIPNELRNRAAQILRRFDAGVKAGIRAIGLG